MYRNSLTTQENLTINDYSGNNMPPSDPARKNMKPRAPPPPGSFGRRSSEDPTPIISVSSWGPSQDRARQGSASAGRRPPPPPGSRPSNGDRDRGSERSRDPPRRRPRRNSDSSVIDAHEAETRDRARTGNRPVGSKSRSKRDASSDKRKKNSALDVIDKLDVTGIYGSGRKFPYYL